MRDFVYDSAACADHRLSFATGVPRHAESRREVIVVAVVRRANAMPYLVNARRGFEIGEAAVLFLDHSIQVVAHSHIQSQAW